MSSEPEVWLQGPVPGVCDELQPVAHSLLQSLRELEAILAPLDVTTANARPGAAAAISFHARHLAGSIDRLLTYAAGEMLSDQQRAALAAEKTEVSCDGRTLFDEARRAIERALHVVRSTDAAVLGEQRAVGTARLPSTVRGLLFHLAEHTLMHVGQIRTTALALRLAGEGHSR
jgi:hypothetical protein